MIWDQAIGSLGLAGGGLASIPARPRRGLAGGRRGGDWELTYDPNVAEGGSGAAPVSSLGGVGRRRLLRPGAGETAAWLATLYHFQKGYMGFFSINFAGKGCL
jgi:hypothetical protein